MTIESVVVGKVTSYCVNGGFKFLSSLFSNDVGSDATKKLEKGLVNQVTRAVKFSKSLEAFRCEDRRKISENTIGLSINTSIRQSFQSVEGKKVITENDLLLHSTSQLILGDPGAGKTTTLKRLIGEAIRLIFEEEDESFPYTFPIFFKLAEITINDSFFTFFAKSLGISYETVKKEIEYDAVEQVRKYDPEDEYADGNGFVYKDVVVKKSRIDYEYKDW